MFGCIGPTFPGKTPHGFHVSAKSSQSCIRLACIPAKDVVPLLSRGGGLMRVTVLNAAENVLRVTASERHGVALRRMLKVLGISVHEPHARLSDTDTITSGHGGLDRLPSKLRKRHRSLEKDPWFQARFKVEMERIAERDREKASKRRVRCCAKTRKGTPCKNMSEPGKQRCKFHGGMSTGPKSFEGKEKIAEAQRKRWAEYRKRNCEPGGSAV